MRGVLVPYVLNSLSLLVSTGDTVFINEGRKSDVFYWLSCQLSGDENEYIRWWALQFANVKLQLVSQVGGS